MYCLDEHVAADNEVRLIDLFVDSLNLTVIGFKVDYEENGRRRIFKFGRFRQRSHEKRW